MQTNFLDELLKKRGVHGDLDRERFLHPSYDDHLHDPFLMPDMERAVVRLFEAIEGEEKIVVYSDYDCDGIPGAVILHDLLKKIGCEVSVYPDTNHGEVASDAQSASPWSGVRVYIPDRHDEGYGLNHDAVEQFIADGVSLLITIDLGSTDAEDIAYAQANGIDVIVTDHHLPPPELPKPFALVNPKVPGSVYPDPMLCGSGVIFKFVQGFLAKYREYFKVPVGWEKWLLDMAGLATLSDMVPLQDENRVLAYWGLRVMRKSPRPGFGMLLVSAKVDQKNLSEDDVAFMVTPRINAASRMGTPMDAFRLLATDDEKEAAALVMHLEKINTERKSLVATIMKKVKKTLEDREEKDIIVIGDPSWRIGILGLVAGKVCEEYQKPTFVWGREGGNGEGALIKGSCRSPKGINIVEIMRKAEDAFLDVGGHAQAGGFSLADDAIHTLEAKLLDAYNVLSAQGFSTEGEVVEEPVMLPLGSLYEEHYDAIASFAPFGFGNPKPVFHFLDTSVADAKLFGKEKNHLELTLVHERGERKAISFFVSDAIRDNLPKKGSPITLLGTLEISYFAGRTTKRIRIEKIL